MCIIPDCDSRGTRRGLCSMHYQRAAKELRQEKLLLRMHDEKYRALGKWYNDEELTNSDRDWVEDHVAQGAFLDRTGKTASQCAMRDERMVEQNVWFFQNFIEPEGLTWE